MWPVAPAAEGVVRKYVEAVEVGRMCVQVMVNITVVAVRDGGGCHPPEKYLPRGGASRGDVTAEATARAGWCGKMKTEWRRIRRSVATR